MKMPCVSSCEKRHENCHASCQEYAAWKMEHETQKAELDKIKKLRGETKDYITHAIKKSKRGRRK